MQHLDEGTIHAWLDGALVGDEAAAVSRHLADCRDCSAMVADARGMIAAAGSIVAALDDVRGGVIPPAPAPVVAGQHSLWRRLHLSPGRAALAATVLIAVATLLTVRHAPQVGGLDAGVPRATPNTAMPKHSPPLSERSAVPVAGPSQEVVRIAAPTKRSEATIATPRVTPPRAAARVEAVAAESAAAVGGASPQRANAATDARSAVSERQLTKAVPLREAVTAARGPAFAESRRGMLDFEACYQLRPDSASSTIAAGVPQRFALVNAVGSAQSVVRSVSPEGRVDSIVPGGSWQRVTPEVVRVQFAKVHERQPLSLQVTTGAVAGQAVVGDRVVTVPIARIECRP